MGSPSVFIGILRESFPSCVSVFTQGACFELYRLLKEVYPSATPWTDSDECHVWTKIDGEFYDIYGVMDGFPDSMIPMEDNLHLMHEASTWKFKKTHYSDGGYL